MALDLLKHSRRVQFFVKWHPTGEYRPAVLSNRHENPRTHMTYYSAPLRAHYEVFCYYETGHSSSPEMAQFIEQELYNALKVTVEIDEERLEGAQTWK